MNKMGNKLPEAELQTLMLNADVDGDGLINYEEFVAATVNLNKLEKEEHFVQVLPACTSCSIKHSLLTYLLHCMC